MRTEITIPFAFDTAPIEHMLQERGEEEALKKVREITENKIYSLLPKKRDAWGNYRDKPDFQQYLDRYMASWIEEHQEEIIDEAALLLAMRAGRKSRWREVLAEIKAQQTKEQA